MADSAYEPKLSDEQVWSIIRDLGKRFGEINGNPDESKRKLFGRVAWRREHLHKLEAANPPASPQLKDGQLYQSNLPLEGFMKLKARITENHFKIRVEPIKNTATLTEWANSCERFENSGLQLAEETYMDQGIQEALADGQLIECYSFLHWSMAEHVWPPVPKPEMLEPEEYEAIDPSERDNYEPAEEDDTKPTRRYKRTSKALLDDRKFAKADAGFPWWVEVLPADAVMWERDRSLAPGFSKVVVRRSIATDELVEMLRADATGDKLDQKTSPNELNPKIPIYGSRDESGQWEPNHGSWGANVILYQVWTRDECYEYVADAGGQESERVKCFRHPYKMPPFDLCPGIIAPGNDPAVHYLPVMEGVFHIKQVLDRLLTYLMVISEQSAIPYYYWKNISSGENWTDENGQVITVMNRDSATATVAPAGYELVAVPFAVNPALVQAVEMLNQQLRDAMPDAGTAEISASTQPWAIRLQQEQANVQPQQLVRHQARSIKVMVQNMLYVHGLPAEDGGFGEPAYTYVAMTGDPSEATPDGDNVVELRPEWVKSLRVDCDISAVSGQERIALIEHGRTLMADPNVKLPWEMFADEYMGYDDPADVEAQYDAEQTFNNDVKPLLVKQMIAQRYGARFVLAANGEFYGMNGVATPEQVLAAHGVNVPQPAQPMQPGAGAQQAQPAPPPTMGYPAPQAVAPPLPPLQVPNTIPIPGLG